MLHHLKKGPDLKFRSWIEKVKADKNTETKASHVAGDDNEPELLASSIRYWNAFVFLNGQRGITDNGFPLPITATDIAAYCVISNEETYDRLFMARAISEMDQIYLEARYSAIEAERKKREQKQKVKNSTRRR